MADEIDLKSAYEAAIKTIDDTYLYAERYFPAASLPQISLALQQLTSCICNDRNLIKFMTDPTYEDAFAELCANEAGFQAVKDMAAALTVATTFVTRRYPEDSRINKVNLMHLELLNIGSVKTRIKGEVKEVCNLIKAYEDSIKACSNKLSVMFINSARHSRLGYADQKANRDDDYNATLGQLIHMFRQYPFALQRSWGQHASPGYSLTVLNNHHFAEYSSSDAIRQPCFRAAALAGSSWAATALESTELSYQDLEHRHVHDIAHDLLDKVQKCTKDANGFHLTDTTWSSSFRPVSEYLDKALSVLKTEQDIRSERQCYAVCGRMSAGKSSLINVMIGRQLLPESGKGL